MHPCQLPTLGRNLCLLILFQSKLDLLPVNLELELLLANLDLDLLPVNQYPERRREKV